MALAVQVKAHINGAVLPITSCQYALGVVFVTVELVDPAVWMERQKSARSARAVAPSIKAHAVLSIQPLKHTASVNGLAKALHARDQVDTRPARAIGPIVSFLLRQEQVENRLAVVERRATAAKRYPTTSRIVLGTRMPLRL